jgi:hypothetical protein
MEQSPSDAESHRASAEIPRLLKNPKVYSVHKGQPLVPIRSQLKPDTFLPYFS